MKKKFKFMAMSKLIGVIAFIFVLVVVIYTLKVMQETGVYDALPQLIISAFGFASIYAGFYLTMAKVEHVEEEKTKREKELAALKESGASQEEILHKEQQIDNLTEDAGEILNQPPQSLI